MTSFDPNNHEHDEDENCLNEDGSIHVYGLPEPNWEFSGWDLLGVAAHTIGGMANMAGQGFQLLAREFYAAAQFSRQQRVEKAKRRSILEDIRELERGGDG